MSALWASRPAACVLQLSGHEVATRQQAIAAQTLLASQQRMDKLDGCTLELRSGAGRKQSWRETRRKIDYLLESGQRCLASSSLKCTGLGKPIQENSKAAASSLLFANRAFISERRGHMDCQKILDILQSLPLYPLSVCLSGVNSIVATFWQQLSLACSCDCRVHELQMLFEPATPGACQQGTHTVDCCA